MDTQQGPPHPRPPSPGVVYYKQTDVTCVGQTAEPLAIKSISSSSSSPLHHAFWTEM